MTRSRHCAIPPAMSLGTDRLVVRAWAKVNLYLEVLGRRDNGYHDIRSIAAPISLCDLVELKPAEEQVVTAVRSEDESTGVPVPDADNLATRAANALKEFTGFEGGAGILLRKSIPIGGGLGGGSADAAAALVGLNRLWGTGLDREQLMRIGAGVGCDVPAILHGGVVCMEGLGERISPVLPPGRRGGPAWHLVIANPGFCVSTREIYSACISSLTSEPDLFTRIVSALKEDDLALAGKSLFNGLQSTVTGKYPLIGMILEAMERAGSPGVLVSGSGASVFGLASSAEHAGELARSLTSRFDGAVWTKVARLLPDGVMVAHGPLEA